MRYKVLLSCIILFVSCRENQLRLNPGNTDTSTANIITDGKGGLRLSDTHYEDSFKFAVNDLYHISEDVTLSIDTVDLPPFVEAYFSNDSTVLRGRSWFQTYVTIKFDDHALTDYYDIKVNVDRENNPDLKYYISTYIQTNYNFANILGALHHVSDNNGALNYTTQMERIDGHPDSIIIKNFLDRNYTLRCTTNCTTCLTMKIPPQTVAIDTMVWGMALYNHDTLKMLYTLADGGQNVISQSWATFTH